MLPSANGGTYATGTRERRDRSSASAAEMSAIPLSHSELSSRGGESAVVSAFEIVLAEDGGQPELLSQDPPDLV